MMTLVTDIQTDQKLSVGIILMQKQCPGRCRKHKVKPKSKAVTQNDCVLNSELNVNSIEETCEETTKSTKWYQ